MPQGQAESRTRVTCHLPVGDVAEEKAFKKIVQYLNDQKDRDVGITGYTFSDPSAFLGYWWSVAASKWIEDTIVLLIVDYKISLSDPAHSLSGEIAQLRETIVNAYKQYGSDQEDVWVVAQKLSRYI